METFQLLDPSFGSFLLVIQVPQADVDPRVSLQGLFEDLNTLLQSLDSGLVGSVFGITTLLPGHLPGCIVWFYR